MTVAKTDWVLLRGMTREARHWGSFPERLAAAIAGARVTCLDLPGNGKLNHLASPHSVEAMADFCHAELAQRGIASPCRVVAMSLGAMVTVAWAQRHPADIGAAVLINTSLRPFSAVHQRLRPANYLRLLSLFCRNPGDREIEAAILQMTARRVINPDVVIGQWLRWRRENPVSRRNALLQLLAAACYRAPRACPLKHLLLLTSAGDGLVDMRCSLKLAAAWGARVAIHPEAGHDLPLDDEVWVLAQLCQWLADTVAANPREG